MNRWIICVLAAMAIEARAAGPIRVALMEFEDQTGTGSDELLGGAIKPAAVAGQSGFLLASRMLNSSNFVLVDRRDFIAQIERHRAKDGGEKASARPTFLQAAQALKADVVLRGTLMAFSTGKQIVNQGDYETELSTLTVRVGLEAIDARDGAVMAMASGSADRSFRQTKQVRTSLGESDVLGIVEAAIAQALPAVEQALRTAQARLEERPTVRVSVKTAADPALVEIDGILVGSTPLDRFEVYKGDHVLSISRPGYQEITKRILLDKDMAIEAPMIRVQLSADDLKQIMEKINVGIITADPALILTPLEGRTAK
jgi:hypothetical protein